MNLIKLIVLLLFLIPHLVMADCETYSGLSVTKDICWSEAHKAYVSKSCLTTFCEAVKFISSQASIKLNTQKLSGGENPDSRKCHQLKYSVLVLKDPRNNEQSFCQFPDGSLIDTGSFSRKIK